MKAQFVNELNKFERTGESLDKLNIGVGPGKYIEELEKILNLSNIKWDKSPTDDGFQWNIRWKDKESERFIYLKLIPRKGWTYPGNMGELLETPFSFMDFIINEIYGNVSSKISNLKKEILKLKKVEQAKNILKKYNES
ncbi:MAG: hypothetical protein PHF86_00660 [Candidatus Nanoarchaeia archaeon]|nr:hypothetical protein [Candidatus Nanoarchaeia archaeon]